MSKWRHKKRGTTYIILQTDVSLQCSASPEFEQMFDDDVWTVYQNTETGAVYVRPTEEFFDGRFEQII